MEKFRDSIQNKITANHKNIFIKQIQYGKMKKILLVASLGVLFMSCEAQSQGTNNQEAQAQSSSSEGTYKILSAAEFEKAMNKDNITIVDVRTPEEYQNGHLKTAQNINYFDSDFQEKMALFDKEKPLYIYCKSGNRSGKAGKIIQKMGFKEVYDLQGGVSAWSGALEQ